MTTKMTYTAALSFVLTNCELPADVSEKLTALKEQTEKRNSALRKPTKKQDENAAVKTQIKEHLTDCEPMTCGEIANMVGISGQKCSALLTQLIKAGEVVKTTEKRVSKFALAGEDDPVQALPGELDA